MAKPPSAGVSTVQMPGTAAAGDTLAKEKRPNQARLVVKAINFTSAQAAPVPPAPMITAMPARTSMRQSALKSPSLDSMERSTRCGREAVVTDIKPSNVSDAGRIDAGYAKLRLRGEGG